MAYTKRKILFSGLLGIVSIGAVASPTWAAAEPSSIHKMSRSVLHEQIGKAIAANDYEAFAKAIAGKPGAGTVTREQFNAFVEARALRLAGKYKEAQLVLQNAGIAHLGHGYKYHTK